MVVVLWNSPLRGSGHICFVLLVVISIAPLFVLRVLARVRSLTFSVFLDMIARLSVYVRWVSIVVILWLHVAYLWDLMIEITL